MESPTKPKKDGKGSYRSEYWYYPVMEGTGKKRPWNKIEKYHVLLERYANNEWQNNNSKSCFYHGDIKKYDEIQKKWDYDMFGRVIILRDDVVMLKHKYETLTYIPLYYKGNSLILQCIERPDSRCKIKPTDCFVITEQVRDNKQRKEIQWKYKTRGINKLPDVIKNSTEQKQDDQPSLI